MDVHCTTRPNEKKLWYPPFHWSEMFLLDKPLFNIYCVVKKSKEKVILKEDVFAKAFSKLWAFIICICSLILVISFICSLLLVILSSLRAKCAVWPFGPFEPFGTPGALRRRLLHPTSGSEPSINSDRGLNWEVLSFMEGVCFWIHPLQVWARRKFDEIGYNIWKSHQITPISYVYHVKFQNPAIGGFF